MATMDEMRELLVKQCSADPRQTLHRVMALAFGPDGMASFVAKMNPKPQDPPPATKKKIFSKKKIDSD